MKSKVVLSIAIILLACASCTKSPNPGPAGKLPPDVANAWMKMQIRLTRSTTGFNSVVSDRSFAYAGLTMYEALVPSTSGYQSLLSQVGGNPVFAEKNPDKYYWPASVNASMALITKSFFENTSAANMASIDSLEAVFATSFQDKAPAEKIQNAVDYGRKVASAIFDWSKTDGAHQAYAHIVDPTYIPPQGPGLWEPTFPAFGPPVHPHWGENRSFIANIAASTQPAPPIPYSADAGSPFYNMVNELYTISLSLSHEDSTIAKFWGDQPGNLNVPAHSTNILIQLIEKNKLSLGEATAAFALHGIAMYDASVSVFKTKYKYNQVRPITYIRNIMLHSTWNSVIPTPAHPEYAAAHSVITSASATVLEKFFGAHYKFTDHTYDETYGARTFNSFEEYAMEAGKARVLAGIHYSPSVSTGLKQGRLVGAQVLKLKLSDKDRL